MDRATRLDITEKPRHGSNATEGILGERLQVLAQRVAPPHPLQNEVVQNRIVLDELVQLAARNYLGKESEREGPVEVNNPSRP